MLTRRFSWPIVCESGQTPRGATRRRAALNSELNVALLTAGKDKPYAFGLTHALFEQDVRVDLICGDDLNISEFQSESRVNVLSFRKEPRPGASVLRKAWGTLQYYGRLVRYAWSAQPNVFHILWNNKFETIDRVFLMLYYKLLGKRLVLTAHNVNAGTRDDTDTWFNRATLALQYRLCDHIFIHTDKMKQGLIREYGVPESALTVVRFGINNAVRRTALTVAEAKRTLGITTGQKTILFFGNIAPYKGLEFLIAAFRRVATTPGEYRLIIAGRPKGGSESYWSSIKSLIGEHHEREGVILKIEYIADDDTELYFKAADVLALPYVNIFQSGVLFLSYSFGLPVIAADVGSLREDVVEGHTGLMCAPRDAEALAKAIETYFASDLFRHLDERRLAIREYAMARHSWGPIAGITRDVYTKLFEQPA